MTSLRRLTELELEIDRSPANALEPAQVQTKFVPSRHPDGPDKLYIFITSRDGSNASTRPRKTEALTPPGRSITGRETWFLVRSRVASLLHDLPEPAETGVNSAARDAAKTLTGGGSTAPEQLWSIRCYH